MCMSICMSRICSTSLGCKSLAWLWFLSLIFMPLSVCIVFTVWVCVFASMCVCVCACVSDGLCINMQEKQLAWLMAVPPHIPPRFRSLLQTLLIQLKTASSSSYALLSLLEASRRSRSVYVCICVHLKYWYYRHWERRLEKVENRCVEFVFTVMMKGLN